MLFEPSLPSGFQYIPEWLSQAEERELLGKIQSLSFDEVRMHGVVAKRQVVHFGWDYGYESWRIVPAQPVPEWLMPLRDQTAALAGMPAEAFEEVLISRYAPGAGIGWHRDAPMFGPIVVGVSLLGACRMRLQHLQGGQRETAACLLAPRSAYVISDLARFSWQHSIPPTKELRYSITFRSVRNNQ